MGFTRLEVKDFALLEDFETDLTNLGLVLIKGVNNDRRSANSNYAGKSLIFEALLWGIWGQTIRDEKSKLLIRWDAKQSRVRVDFETEKGSYYVVRTEHRTDKNKSGLEFWQLSPKPVEITRKTRAETQEWINKILGIDFLTFKNTVIFGQDEVIRFAGLTDAAIKEIFTKLLSFENYDEALENVKDGLVECENELGSVVSRMEQVEMTIEKSQELVDEASEKKREFASNQKLKVEELEEEREELQERLEECNKDLSDKEELSQRQKVKEKAVEKAKKALYEVEEALVANDGARDAVVSKLREPERGYSVADNLVCGWEDEMGSKLDRDECPECATPVTDKVKARIRKRYEDKIKEQKQVMKSTKAIMKKHKAELLLLDNEGDELGEQYVKAEKLHKKKCEELTDIRVELTGVANASRMIEDCEEQLEKQDSRIAKVKAEKFTFQDVIKREEAQVAESETELKALENKQLQLEEDMENLEFWKRGFGNAGIKNTLIEEVIPQLNETVAKYNQMLTDGEAEVIFHGQTQLASGEMRDKFKVDVRLTGGNGKSTYKGASGGLKRRIDLAVAFALRDLMIEQSGYTLGMAIFDECFDALDAVGCDVAMGMLEEQAEQLGTVFVITHKKELAGQFHTTWEVRRKDDKSTVFAL